MRVNPRIQLRLMRKFARDQKYRLTAQEGGGEREKARRVSQMLCESLRAENGVVVNYGTLGEAMLAQSDRNEPWYKPEPDFIEQVGDAREEPSNV